MTFSTGVDCGLLITLLGLLWKLSQMAGQVNMMWKVFAAEHGLDPVRGHKQRG
jgi:hypothetical protein